ncbi:DUF1801 domain-containing protein [Herbiconiux sp.]|uniref:DUF1801 domain-containing protein n=1 Tax=Herbiconiux sp. TaxID=1871186 RepID=UPI0025BE9A6B|nr:DUF1801 domain-containing protein [Herbiconiux sp.]
MTAASAGFSAEEKAAMKDRAAELKADARRGKAEEKAAADAATMREKIEGMPQPDRGMAERLHEIVGGAAPDLLPKLFYGQPAWTRDGKPVVFFRSGQQDKERYSTLGFSSKANLDEPSGFWPTSYALTELNDETATTIARLVTRAAS